MTYPFTCKFKKITILIAFFHGSWYNKLCMKTALNQVEFIMRKKLFNHFTNLLLPCLGFSVLTGLCSALLITLFKILAEWAVHTSASLYGVVRENPVWLPLLVLGAAAIGFAASLLLSVSHSCKGGGIPTSVAAIRGIIGFKWVAGAFLLPVSALMSFLAGLPLGTEGPCVQMGTAVGNGVIRCFGGRKHQVWRRYLMTGGASAGFSIATAAPVSAIIFSMEELHKHFSPMLLSIASISVITAQIAARALSAMGIGSMTFFSLPEMQSLPLSKLYAPILVGLLVGVCSIFFTRLYHFVDRTMRKLLGKLSIKLLFPILFALISIIGFFFADTLSSGHSLVESLLAPGAVWYMLILLFLVRAISMTVCNTSGATGGVFLPTLAFGAIIGALCANALLSLGWIGTEHYMLIVVLGITSFLGSTSRIPLTACVFAIEVLSGINNVIPIVLATAAALLVVEASGIEDFTDTVINATMHRIAKGKKETVVEATLTVCKNSFVIGKELRDVLWPNACVVVSFQSSAHTEAHGAISEGDVITVRYTTYDPQETQRELNALVGEQA